MRDKPKPAKQAPDRLSDVTQVAANTLIFGLSLIERVSECAPVPGLRAAVGGVNLILERFNVRPFHCCKTEVNRGTSCRMLCKIYKILTMSSLPSTG